VIFEADYDKIEVQNIVMTASSLRDRKTSQNFFQFGPLPIKISGYASEMAYLLLKASLHLSEAT